MHARAKIESLTNTWYGFAVFSAVSGLLMEGIFSIWNIFWAGVSLCTSLFITFLIGRRLLAKGRITRFILVAGSGLMTLFGAYGTYKASMMFISAWELKYILAAVSSALTAWMMAKSFRTLTDASVKQYFA